MINKFIAYYLSIFVALFNIQNVPSHPAIFFEKETFYKAIQRIENQNNKPDYHISGGITPHHLLPGYIIADFYKRLSEQKPKTIVIIGPNHEEKGDFNALTSKFGWQTPFGIVKPDTELINLLVDENLLKVNEDVLSTDHSAAGSMPFIKYFTPNSKVVPILVSAYMTEENAKSLASSLNKYLDKDSVMVAAVDFSHYQSSEVADKKDETTLKLLNNFDYQEIIRLGNDYLDSPPSILILLMLMQERGTTSSEILEHTNSGQITGKIFTETTSYFSIFYH